MPPLQAYLGTTAEEPEGLSQVQAIRLAARKKGRASMTSDAKAITIILIVGAFLAAIATMAVIAMDSFTADERNQLPRCDTVTEVLVGLGDFYDGRWSDYTCASGNGMR